MISNMLEQNNNEHFVAQAYVPGTFNVVKTSTSNYGDIVICKNSKEVASMLILYSFPDELSVGYMQVFNGEFG